jgi:hypothetical protein
MRIYWYKRNELGDVGLSGAGWRGLIERGKWRAVVVIISFLLSPIKVKAGDILDKRIIFL